MIRAREMRLRDDAGVTLVELLIAVLLFAVLSAGALVALSGQQRSTLVQQQTSNTLDSARSALDALTRQIRVVKAGMPEGRVLFNGGSGSIPGSATQCPAGSRVIAVVEVTNSSTGPDALRVLIPDGGQWGTLSADVDGVATQVQLRTADGNRPAVTTSDWLLMTSFDQAVLFVPQNTPAVVTCGAGEFCLTKLGLGAWPGVSALTSGTVLLRANWREYTVSTTTFGNTDYPALVVTRQVPGASPVTEPAALGIEDLQVALAVDEIVPGTPGRIDPENAGIANADEWVFNAPGETLTSTGALADSCELDELRAIRISIVARGSSPGGRNVTGGRPALEDRPAGAADDIHRVVLRTVVALR